MARLIVEFTRAPSDPLQNANLEDAESLATHILEPGTGNDETTAAPAQTQVVDIYADGAAYWVHIASDPTAAVEGATSRFVAEGERRQFKCSPGMILDAVEDA